MYHTYIQLVDYLFLCKNRPCIRLRDSRITNSQKFRAATLVVVLSFSFRPLCRSHLQGIRPHLIDKGLFSPPGLGLD